MPIKAADYSVGFDTQAARANWAELEKALQDGSMDVKTAFAELSASFNQVTNVHRTGKKEVDAFTKLIKEEKQETRTLGFLMRNASESVSALSETFGGPEGLGRSMSVTYARFDQLNFALEGVAAAGEKAGGSFAKYAGLLGGVAVPAGMALAAFSLMKEQFEQDSAEIEGLEKSIRSLKVELGMIPATQLEELNRQMDELNKKKPEMGFFASLFQISPGQTVYLLDVAKQVLGIERDKLATLKAQTEEMERQKQAGIQRVREDDALLESMMRNAEEHAKLNVSDQNSVILLQQQYQIRQSHLANMEMTLSRLRDSGATSKEILEYDTRITAEKIAQRDLQKKISDEQARTASRKGDVGMLGIIDIWKEEYNFLENAQKRLVMEARNAPLKLRGVASVEPVSTEDLLAGFTEYQDQMIGMGNILANSISSGFTRGFQTGKFMLSDFASAMMQSVLQLAAQEAAFSAVAGLLSLIPGVGSFASIAGALGSRFFKGKANSRVGESGSGGLGIDVEQTLRRGGPSIQQLTSDRGTTLLQQLVSETRDTRMAIKNNRPALYVGGVTTPDAIVTENIGVAERRRARRLK